MEKRMTFTPSAEYLEKAAQSAENLKLAREGKISKKEYDRRERDLVAQFRAESNVAQGLPPDYVSPGEIEWRRILRERRAKRGTKSGRRRKAKKLP